MDFKTLEAKIDFLTDLVIANHAGEVVHGIGGYVQGRSSKGDGFFLLFSDKPYLVLKVCRVYQEQFPRLPPGLDRAIPLTATDANIDRERAEKLGIFREVDPFMIVTYKGKGNETRFSRVLLTVAQRLNGETLPTGTGDTEHIEPLDLSGVADAIKASATNFFTEAVKISDRYASRAMVIRDLESLGYSGIPGAVSAANKRVEMFDDLVRLFILTERGFSFEAAADHVRSLDNGQ